MAFSAGALALVVAFNAVEIAARRLGRSSPLLVELSITLATAFYLVGYTALLHHDDDVVMEYVYRRIPVRIRRWLDVTIALGVLGFFVVLLAKSVALLRLTRPMTHPVFPVSQSYTVIPVVLAAAICLWVAGYRVVAAATRVAGREMPVDAVPSRYR
jgi:TRAP-type C4-dicarboxylate transport system permease small subunit